MKKEAFQYMLVAPAAIIRERKGPVGLENDRIVGLNKSRLTKRLANQRIIEQYLTEMGMKGWELVTSLAYEGLPLPYGGSLIFRKKYYIEDENPEISTVMEDQKENLDKGNLYQEFEKLSGKHAVWQGKETKAYRKWLSEKTVPEDKPEKKD